MFNFPAVFVDIETTGVSWRRNKIIEIAAVRYENGAAIERLNSLVNPGSYLPDYISSITGISNEDLQEQPYFDEIAAELVRLCEGAVFIAHNARFDYSFIKRQLEELGYNFRPRLLCTVRLSRKLYPAERRHSLEQIIAYHNIKVKNRHRALDDTLAMVQFCQKAHHEQPEKFNQAVAAQLKSVSTPPNLEADLVNNLPSTCGVYIFEDKDGKPLYVGKSINIKKRIKSHFTSDSKFEKEMRLSLGVHNIRTITTENELEALLLESRLVKELLPLHNRMLRRHKTTTAIIRKLDNAGYANLSIEQIDLNECSELGEIYGLFATKAKARQALVDHQKTFSLCSKLLGLEKTAGSCFMAQLGRCQGACTGKEMPQKYNLRVDLALQNTRLKTWPYQSAVVVTHKNSGHKSLVLDQWRVVGEINEDGFSEHLPADGHFFDLDVYKILSSYLRTKKKELLITPFDLAAHAASSIVAR